MRWLEESELFHN